MGEKFDGREVDMSRGLSTSAGMTDTGQLVSVEGRAITLVGKSFFLDRVIIVI